MLTTVLIFFTCSSQGITVYQYTQGPCIFTEYDMRTHPHVYCLYTCTLYMYCISKRFDHLQPARKSLICIKQNLRSCSNKRTRSHQRTSAPSRLRALPVCLSRGCPESSDYPPGPPGTPRYWSHSDTRRVRRMWKRSSEE